MYFCLLCFWDASMMMYWTVFHSFLFYLYILLLKDILAFFSLLLMCCCEHSYTCHMACKCKVSPEYIYTWPRITEGYVHMQPNWMPSLSTERLCQFILWPEVIKGSHQHLVPSVSLSFSAFLIFFNFKTLLIFKMLTKPDFSNLLALLFLFFILYTHMVQNPDEYQHLGYWNTVEKF